MPTKQSKTSPLNPLSNSWRGDFLEIAMPHAEARNDGLLCVIINPCAMVGLYQVLPPITLSSHNAVNHV